MTPLPSWGEGVRVHADYSRLHHAPSTRAMLAGTLKRFGRHVWERAPHLVTRQDAEAFQVRELERGLAPASVNRECRELQGFFSWLEASDYTVSNPFRLVRHLKVIRRRRHFLPLEDVERLLEALDLRGEKWYADLVRVIGNTGLRLGEALHVKAEDVDLSRRMLVIRCREEYLTKDREEREIPLNPVAFEILERRRSLGGWVWAHGGPGRRGRLPRLSTVSHGLTRVARALGMPGINWYQLRHVFATALASKVQPYVLCAILGHASVRTTERWYLERSHLILEAPPVVG